MKRLVLAASIATALVAAHADSFIDNARVRSSEPQYENVSVPREECTQQYVTETQRTAPSGPSVGGMIVGGVAGGVLGHQVGNGRGRDAATAVGAVVGALAGDRIGRATNGPEQVQEVPRQVTSCRTVNEVQSRITGYRVNYDYRGQNYTTMMRENPGPNLQVRVSIDPIVPR